MRPAQAAAWLRSGIPTHRLPDWKPVFSQLRQQPDGPLAYVLRTPLAVWLVRAVYHPPGRDPAELTDATRFGTPDAVRDYLLDALIPALVSTGAAGPPRRWAAADAAGWLSFIADLLAQDGTRDLARRRALPRSRHG